MVGIKGRGVEGADAPPDIRLLGQVDAGPALPVGQAGRVLELPGELAGAAQEMDGVGGGAHGQRLGQVGAIRLEQARRIGGGETGAGRGDHGGAGQTHQQIPHGTPFPCTSTGRESGSRPAKGTMDGGPAGN